MQLVEREGVLVDLRLAILAGGDPLLGPASLAEPLVNSPEGCLGLMRYGVLPRRGHS